MSETGGLPSSNTLCKQSRGGLPKLPKSTSQKNTWEIPRVSQPKIGATVIKSPASQILVCGRQTAKKLSRDKKIFLNYIIKKPNQPNPMILNL